MNRTVWILSVEGRRTAHRKIASHLGGINFELVKSPGHHSALEKLGRQRFDLIMIGPEIDQEGRLYLISSAMAVRPVPAVLVFVKPGEEEMAVECMRHGASDYIIKDFDERFLVLLPTVVQNILRRQQLEQEKLSMLDTLKQRNLVLTSLNRIGSELTSILEPDRLINRLMRAAIEILSAEGGSLWLWSPNKPDTLVCQAVLHRTNTPPLQGLEHSASEGVLGWVMTHNQSTLLDQAEQDRRFSHLIDRQINFQTRMIMAVPLRYRDRAIGALEFVNKLTGRFDEDDLVIAETLAATAATALENARLVDQLRLHTTSLEERNEELNAFGYTLAHDLQNILARIIGFSEIIASEMVLDAPVMPQEQLIRISTLISRNSKKMSDIIEALLLFASVRDADVSFDEINMKPIVADALERLSSQIEEKQVQIHYPDEWPLSLGYAPWVEEVWYNYIGNAIKYGGDPPYIELGATVEHRQKSVCFWIKDNGEGVDQAFVHHLFQPYKQQNRLNGSGYGLGLSIVARIVRRLGGRVGYDRRPDGGSCFYFTLPTS